MKVRFADNDAKHLNLFKAGRVMKFEDYGDKKYKSSKTSLFPEKSNNDYSYCPSTAWTRWSYRKLSEKKREYYIKKAKDTFIWTTLPLEAKLKIRNKYCYGLK